MNKYKFNFSRPGPMIKDSIIVEAEDEENAWNKFSALDIDEDIEVDSIQPLPEEDLRQMSFFE